MPVTFLRLVRTFRDLTPFELQDFSRDLHDRLDRRFLQSGQISEGDVVTALIEQMRYLEIHTRKKGWWERLKELRIGNFSEKRGKLRLEGQSAQ